MHSTFWYIEYYMINSRLEKLPPVLLYNEQIYLYRSLLAVSSPYWRSSKPDIISRKSFKAFVHCLPSLSLTRSCPVFYFLLCGQWKCVYIMVGVCVWIHTRAHVSVYVYVCSCVCVCVWCACERVCCFLVGRIPFCCVSCSSINLPTHSSVRPTHLEGRVAGERRQVVVHWNINSRVKHVKGLSNQLTV